jgi:Na+-translocating ferredoxin:NAD+ oxidoreductase RnfD subunit
MAHPGGGAVVGGGNRAAAWLIKRRDLSIRCCTLWRRDAHLCVLYRHDPVTAPLTTKGMWIFGAG